MTFDPQPLTDELTDTFIRYQFRLENPMPSPGETFEDMAMKYRTDPIFRNKVRALVGGVMSNVPKHLEAVDEPDEPEPARRACPECEEMGRLQLGCRSETGAFRHLYHLSCSRCGFRAPASDTPARATLLWNEKITEMARQGGAS